VDTTTDPGADRKLSTAMAQAAARELADLGVPRDRVTAAGRGGESPRLPNFTARGRAANRRVEAVAIR
jgi:outer membrane protein OmpA-like peptidoglycan-associated protein